MPLVFGVYDYYVDVLVWMAFFAIDCDDVDVMATMTAEADDVGGGGGVDDGDVEQTKTTTPMMIHLSMPPAFHLMHCQQHYL